MPTNRLTPTSYLVLGLLAREGPSTPYDLEGHVRPTLGNFWSFPHTLLYSEPSRLAGLGLVVEERETSGRRRRVFAITSAGRAALKAWLDTPADEPTELRDPGLLQLFFGDLASAKSRLRLAEQQLAIHQAKLDAYREDLRLEHEVRGSGRGQRTVEHWRGETLPMGIRYEGAAVDFWAEVAARARASLNRDAGARAGDAAEG
jgi:DNA-binding PadR family transcriptional regulator